MQLMQVYSQKSTSTTLPRRSLSFSGRELNQVLPVNSGAAIRGAISAALVQVGSRRLKVVKANTDENMQTPAKFGVRGIPNLVIVKGGQVKEQIVGAVAKQHLVRAIDSALA